MPTAAIAPRRRPPKLTSVERPSILDPWLKGDLWIKRCTTGDRMVLYIQCQPVSTLAAGPFDLVSLNTRLFDMRHRLPRGMVRK